MTSIPVYQPHFTGREKEYVQDCLDTGWISSRGPYIQRFEQACRDYIGTKHALSVSNGTVALHLAMLLCGIEPGDEVILPTFTYVASANAVRYVGATPIFADSLADTWQVDPMDVARKITSRTKAIMAVHIYGLPCDLDSLAALAARHGLLLIEDAAEAFGSRIRGRHVGTQGDVATFSFFGNKTVTTGEGGLLVCRRDDWADRAALLKSQYASQERRYWHEDVGYNYRMTNLCAAIGLAQLEGIDHILERKRRLAGIYREKLSGLPLRFHAEPADMFHSHWMVSILVPQARHRDALMRHLEAAGIETRPFFYPVHTMPMFADPSRPVDAFPTATDISARGINLPSFPDMTDAQIDAVSSAIHAYFVRPDGVLKCDACLVG